MSERSLAQKLQIKDGRKVRFVNPPEGYLDLLGGHLEHVHVLPEPDEPADIIQVFVHNRQELEEQLPRLKTVLAPQGALWVTYHKGTSKVKTDINRDTIDAYARSVGLEGVAMIAVDDDWSALRLKLSGE